MTETEDELIGIAHVPEGVEMRLLQHGDDFTIVLEDTELMSTQASVSEEALATMTCERLGWRKGAEMLIGGYGMGFTLRAALAALPDDASVTVAEIVPEIIEWALGPMQRFTAGCLDDPRVTLVHDDIAMLIDAARGAYDAILLDVDNGPEGLTRRINDQLYGPGGLQAAKAALKPDGILAIWSADTDTTFPALLRKAGFSVSEVAVKAKPGGKGYDHVIWFAQRADD